MRRPELLDQALDPRVLLDKLDDVERARGAHPERVRVAQQHYDDIRRDLQSPEGGGLTPRASTPRVDESRPPAVLYLARHPTASQFQSVVTDCFESQLRLARGGLARWWESLKSLLRPFGPCDIRWIEPLLDELITNLEQNKHPFADTKPEPVALGARARVVIAGDWATGLPQARNVAGAIRAALADTDADERHVIHLGDTYYSGTEEEFRRRFLPLWPVDRGSPVKSWSLNGNHDMYAGGHGYFEVLLRDSRFSAQNGASYFCLRNQDWQIVGLDSSYAAPDHPDLAGSQVEWLDGLVSGDALGTILLTHHQPFSAYEEVDSPLAASVGRALAGRRAEAWLWGHEHRCAVYEPGIKWGAYDDFAPYTAIVGHGGVPNLLSGPIPPPPPNTVDREALKWEFTGSYTVGEDTWGLGGFAVLDFEGPRLTIQYFDELGRPRSDSNGNPVAPDVLTR